MNFRGLADSYVSEHLLSDRYREGLLRVANKPVSVNSDSLNRYLRDRLGVVSSVTAANERRMLLTLWRWGYESGRIDKAPRGILAIRVERQSIRAWTGSQIKKLLLAAEQTPGRFRFGLSRRLFLKAWVYLGYETGARWGDLWAMRFAQLENNTIRWSMCKTGDPMHRKLSPACLEAITPLKSYSPNDLILGFACRKRYAMRLWKRLCEAADVEGTSKWLRRSGATHVEQQAPGKGRVFLGHRTHGLAERHYFDRAQLMQDEILVPSLR